MADDQRLLQLFEQALDLPADQRRKFLFESCGDDVELLESVDSLLQIHEEGNTFLSNNASESPNAEQRLDSNFANFLESGLRNAFRTNNPANDSGLSQSTDPAKIESLGDYLIRTELGRGGMGVVYEAVHQTMQRPVALKVLRSPLSDSEEALNRFLREARSAGRLHHSNIVPVFEVGVDHGIHFYAMQLIKGDGLNTVIEDLRKLEREFDDPSLVALQADNHFETAVRLFSGDFREVRFDSTTDGYSQLNSDSQKPRIESTETTATHHSAPSSSSSGFHSIGGPKERYFRRVARIGIQVADALAYAHEHGILHRDIKPSNLILDESGTVWVTDFGLAKAQGEDLTQTGDFVGTLRYMAPERFNGEADERSDLYSFGLTLFELCTLQCAFDKNERVELIHQVTHEEIPKPSQHAPAIPKDLETIILKCADRNPSSRYLKASDAAADLRRFLSDLPILARRATLSERVWRLCRRNPVVTTMLSIVFCLLVYVTYSSTSFALKTHRLNESLIEKTDIAVRAERRMKEAYNSERQASLSEIEAHAASRINLYHALYRQVQAERQNPLTSRREETLAALDEAARLLPSISLTQEQAREEVVKLRTQAAAVFGQTDLIVDSEKLAGTTFTSSVSYGPQFETYATSTGTIELRSVGTNEKLLDLPQHEFRATDFDFSPDGRYLAALHRVSGLRPRYLRVWDLKDQSAILDAELSIAQIRIATMSQSVDRPHAAAISTESTVTIFPNCEESRQVKRDFERPVRGGDFSNDGSKFFVVGDFPTLKVWDIATNTVLDVPIESASEAVDCSHAENRIAVGLQSGEIHVLDIDRDFETVAMLRGHTDSVHALALSTDASLIVSTSWDYSTRLWDVSEGREIKRLEKARLRSEFSADNENFSCVFDDGRVVVYRVIRNDIKRVFVDRFDLPRRNDVSIHPIVPRIAVSATSGYVEFWDVPTGRLVEILKSERAFEAKISSDGTQLLTSGRHGLRLWDLDVSSVNSPEELPTVTCQIRDRFTKYDTYQMDCTPDFKRTAFVTLVDKDIVIADLNSFVERSVLKSEFEYYKVALSPDGRWVAAVSSQPRLLTVWNAADGTQVSEFSCKEPVTGIAFSSDNRFLAANGSKGRFLWRVADWKQVSQAMSDDRYPGDVCFSPDGRLIAMPHDRYSLEIIDRVTFEPVIRLISTSPRDSEAVNFSIDGRQLISTRGRDFEVWDLVELRSRLDNLQIDWNDHTEETD